MESNHRKKLLLFIAVSFFFLKYIFKIDEKIVSVEVKTTSNATPIYRIVDSMMNELITHVILKKSVGGHVLTITLPFSKLS